MLERITEHVWYLPKEDPTYRPALGYICCGRSSLIVDTGNSPEHVSLFYGNIRSIGLPDPEFAALTHWHWDHVFGLSGSPAKSIAHVITNEKLQNMQRWDWSDNSLNSRVTAGLEIPFCAEMIKKEMPARHSFKVKPADISFMEKCSVRLEDLKCELVHVGGPHSEDSVVVFVPQERVLFLGDCNLEDLYTGGGSLRLNEYKQLIKRLEKFDADWFVPSHDVPHTKDEFIAGMRKIEQIGDALEGVTELPEGLKKLTKKLGHQPDEDEKKYAEQFVIGNHFSYMRSPI